MFFIVRGRGTLRYGNETRPIRAGDVICCPTGGAETAHQIINDSDGTLAYPQADQIKITGGVSSPLFVNEGGIKQGIFCVEVVAKIKMACVGGSSSVLRSALNASVVIWCASSII